MTRLLIATPCALGYLSIPYARSLALTIAELTRQGVTFHYAPMEASCIVRARNLAVAMLLADPSFTHLCFIDADMGWDPPDAPLKMIAADEDVVCGAYLSRGPQPRWTFKAASLALDGKGLVPLTHAPTGFFVAKRRVFERLAAERPDLKTRFTAAPGGEPHSYLFFDARRSNDGSHWLGEDYGFSETWTALGGTLQCHPDLTLYHEFKAWNGGNLRKFIEGAKTQTVPPQNRTGPQ
jgi:hypothetical protein